MHTSEHQYHGFVQPTEATSYRLVPFTVPPDTVRLDVRYTYGDPSEVRDGNTIDIGLFDAHGTDAHGFRGWSGSDRATLSLTEAWATPGYTAGPLSAGIWHVLLGLYEIAPNGCAYTITVTVNGDAETPPPDEPITGTAWDALPGARPVALPGWLRGDLHCHTLHSDGDAPPADVLATARTLGLDFLAITDHNTRSHHVALAALDPDGLTLIPGVEITTYRGHANVWGLPGEFIEFRSQTPTEMYDALAGAVTRGGVVSINHPKPGGPQWEWGPLTPIACVEVWNGPWQAFNTAALAYADDLLRGGRRVVFVGGSDTHHYHSPRLARLGRPTTWLHAPTVAGYADLLDAIRSGHVFLSRDPRGPQVYLSSGASQAGDLLPRPSNGRVPVSVHVRGAAGATLHFVTERGIVSTLSVADDDEIVAVRVDLGGAWTVRVQVVESPTPLVAAEMLALTNPLFFTD